MPRLERFPEPRSMAHRALTLKYRPQVFADMIGQDHVSRVLERALETGRVAHAYLFTGARGVGKTTSARILAKSLNCQKRASGELAGADPCNECASCREITSGVSLDVSEIDGASNRGIADVQALREKVRFTPTGGKYRVVIIDEVHQLSNDAFAALLKTLEEPPPHLVFIFATTDPQKVPDTIRSRTQRYDFARVAFRKVADRLLEIQKREAADADGVNFTLTEGAALLVAHKSEGSMRDAVGALDQVVSSGEPMIDEALVRRVLGMADREVFFELAHAIVSRDPKEALRALHHGFDKGLDPRDLAEGLSEHIRHVLILKVDPDGGDLVAASREDLERLRAQGDGWSENDLLRLLRIASEALWPMRDSPQPLVHLEAAVLQMATLEPGETLSELLSRLESIEQRLGGGEAPRPGGVNPPRGAAPASTDPAVARPGSVTRQAGTSSAGSAFDRKGGYFAPPANDMPARLEVPPARTAPDPAAGRRPLASLAAARVTTPTPMSAPARSGAASAPTAPPASPAIAGPGAPAASAVLTDAPLDTGAETQSKWRACMESINSRKRLLGAFLEESAFLGCGGGRLVLGMDDLHRAVVEEKDNRAIVADELKRVFGEVIELRCVPLAPGGGAPERPTAEQTEAMVAKALAWFGAEAPPAGSQASSQASSLERTEE